MKDKTEFCLAVSAFLFLLAICGIAYMKKTITDFHLNGGSFTMNGEKFQQIGMIQYQSDKGIVYFPIYEKR